MQSDDADVVYAQFEAAFEFPQCVMALIASAIQEHYMSPSVHAAYHKFETKVRLELNAVLKGSTLNKEDKRLARIALKACFVLLALHDFEVSDTSLLYSEDVFLTHYPEFVGLAEVPLLLTFRNIIAVSLTLMEADNNKAKHLTIATRLSEGKDARYVTGSGQTEPTSRRTLIFERESRAFTPGVSPISTISPTTWSSLGSHSQSFRSQIEDTAAQDSAHSYEDDNSRIRVQSNNRNPFQGSNEPANSALSTVYYSLRSRPL